MGEGGDEEAAFQEDEAHCAGLRREPGKGAGRNWPLGRFGEITSSSFLRCYHYRHGLSQAPGLQSQTLTSFTVISWEIHQGG